MDPTIVVAAGTILGSAVAVLFKLAIGLFKTQSKQAERLGRLEGERNGIVELSKKTLEVVHSAIAEREEGK